MGEFSSSNYNDRNLHRKKGFNDLILGHRYELFVFVLCIQFIYISMTAEIIYIKSSCKLLVQGGFEADGSYLHTCHPLVVSVIL